MEAGEAWPHLVARGFAHGSRLLLGWDEARGEEDLAAIAGLGGASEGAGAVGAGAASGSAAAAGIDRAALRAALERASRWCSAHGLHLLSFEGDGPGGHEVGPRRWFMAVG